MKWEQEKQNILRRRVMVRKYEREPGKRRFHRTIDEKLRKYEGRAEGYEFLPAMMHLIKRYCADLPENKRNELDVDVAKALDAIPEARNILENVVKRHEAIPQELKRRAFSPKYLTLKTEQAIDTAEMATIMQRSRMLPNRTVEDVSMYKMAPTPAYKDQDGVYMYVDPGVQPILVQYREQYREQYYSLAQQRRAQGRYLTPPNKYEITFSHLYCVDESDPEWCSSDEPYVMFGVITEEMAESGTPAMGFHTPVYEDVDDGDRRPKSGDEHLRLYGPKAIDSPILIMATCMEHDLGDVTEMTEGARTMLTMVAQVGASAGGAVGWIVAGAAVIGIGVTYLIDLFGADDQIGSSIALSLAEASADAKTSSVSPYVFPSLRFDGGDDDGIYDVCLKLGKSPSVASATSERYMYMQKHLK